MDKYPEASCAFQRILNWQSSHIWTYLIWELWFYVTEMRKNKSKVRFVESSFRQKVRSTFPVAQYCIESPFQNGAIVLFMKNKYK
jgi:hypothetical protein